MDPEPTGRRTTAVATRRIAVVDDSTEQVLVLETMLRSEGFDVRSASDGASAIDLVRDFRPHVVLLDLVMPGIDGLEVCRQIRRFSDAYVVMVTSKDDELDRILGLELGADDYLAKPFSPRELVARLGAMLRRPRVATARSTVTCGAVTVEVDAREVCVRGEPVELTRTEFDLLHTLAARPDRVFTRAMLISGVWGDDWIGDEQLVTTHVMNLRRKLERAGAPNVIRTVRGVGYRAQPPAN